MSLLAPFQSPRYFSTLPEGYSECPKTEQSAEHILKDFQAQAQELTRHQLDQVDVFELPYSHDIALDRRPLMEVLHELQPDRTFDFSSDRRTLTCVDAEVLDLWHRVYGGRCFDGLNRFCTTRMSIHSFIQAVLKSSSVEITRSNFSSLVEMAHLGGDIELQHRLLDRFRELLIQAWSLSSKDLQDSSSYSLPYYTTPGWRELKDWGLELAKQQVSFLQECWDAWEGYIYAGDRQGDPSSSVHWEVTALMAAFFTEHPLTVRSLNGRVRSLFRLGRTRLRAVTFSPREAFDLGQYFDGQFPFIKSFDVPFALSTSQLSASFRAMTQLRSLRLHLNASQDPEGLKAALQQLAQVEHVHVVLEEEISTELRAALSEGIRKWPLKSQEIEQAF